LLLSIVLLTPLVGLALLLFIPSPKTSALRSCANAVALVDFLLCIPLLRSFDKGVTGFQFVERIPWIPTLGAEYHLGIDGFSLLLVTMTTLLGFLAILSSWNAIQHRVKEYYVHILLLQFATIGVFLALDFFLFFVFW
jgi:NADH-quinone oxidoreductase subunit M